MSLDGSGILRRLSKRIRGDFMYLIINGNKHACARRIVTTDTVKYLAVTPTPDDISGKIGLYRDDGFLLAEDDADGYERRYMTGSLLTITNASEQTTASRYPTIESRVAAIENAIEKGLSL
jgi:hypothetical protein